MLPSSLNVHITMESSEEHEHIYYSKKQQIKQGSINVSKLQIRQHKNVLLLHLT